MDIIVHDIAQETLERVAEEIPKDPELDTYRQSLRLKRVVGMKGKAPTWLVYARTSRKRLTDAKKGVEVLYVRPKATPGIRISPFVTVLSNFSPWTADTIPFYPTQREAVIYTRRVSRREHQYVAESRRRDKTKWGFLLSRAGVPASRRLDKTPAKDAAAVEDLAFSALRAEFGGGDRRAVPHWRPAIQQFYRSRFIRYFRRQRRWRRVLIDANYRKWRKPIRSAKVPVGRLKRYIAFQRAIRERL